MSLSQSVIQVNSQVQERQVVLKQIADTFVILKNYIEAIVSGDAEETEIQNIAMVSSLNFLRSQVATCLDKKDTEVLDMGLGYAQQLLEKLDHESPQQWQQHDAAQGTKQNVMGYINAALSGDEVPVFPTMDPQLTPDLVNDFFGDVVGAKQNMDGFMSEMSDPSRQYELAQNQQRLLANGRSIKNGSDGSGFTSTFNANAMTQYYSGPARSAQEVAANRRKKQVEASGSDFNIRNSARDSKGRPDIITPTKFQIVEARNQNGQWCQVRLIQELNNNMAKIETIDGNQFTISKSQIRPCRR